MRESWPYRSDLRTFARLLSAREARQAWRDDSLAKAEKMLFVGFLFIRKLIECNKVTDRCAKSSVTVLRGSIHRDREVSAFLRDDLIDDVNNVDWNEMRVDVHQLADKIIHTWWIFPTTNESSGLAGFIFTTDRKRNSELWLLPTSSIVKVFERFGKSPVRRSHTARDDNGRLAYWRAE